MNAVSIRIRRDRYERLVDAVAALLASYDVAEPPPDEFDVETLAGVTAFDQFDVLRDLAVRLGDARPIEDGDAEDGDAENGDAEDGNGKDSDAEDGETVEVEIHAHHLVAAVAAFPDLAGVGEIPEPDLRVIVEGLCYAYLAELSGIPERRRG